MEHLHSGHRQRVKERFFAEGLEHFAPHEVLEFLLFSTVPRGDTNATAHRLLEHFGSLTNVFEAKYEDLLAIEGVGPKSALLLCSIPGLSRAYLTDTQKKGIVLDTTEKAIEFLSPRFLGAREEQFYVVCLDDKRRVLHCECLNNGAVNRVNVDMRRLMDLVLRVSATAVILAHNHPAQLAVPSNEDIFVTQNMIDLLKAVSVRVIDHLIFSRDDCVSMRDSGYFINFQK